MDPPLATATSPNRIAGLLASDQPVLGVFSGDHTAERGAAMGVDRDIDFVFYSLETGPFDTAALQAYIEAMHGSAAGAGITPRPVVLRIPPLEALETARQRIGLALAAGASGVVVPHVARPDQAAAAVSMLGADLWPANERGGLVGLVIVEDREGVARADDIAATEGVAVVIAGPGDLARAYQGDTVAVERAIQTVLAACRKAGVACGITAGAADVGRRLDEGFRFIIATDEGAVAAGRRAAGEGG